ncbi:hypothetical protein DFJ58DRAFT_863591 [Suillus subalutaceus]|uniref:uncharacterized protein n=1 Tax=Suillus subalutaceus TaxID=48586 RepID=UPI001B883FCD|nr:uncharacterized protein DFJ58DRAFT_863591 [Suillus subalutaceus]KAG1865884.1 hypothetical protein DFJ58DRAFT_863591 [Suillus subalutaceus]
MPPKNIVIFGESGVGKSSIINLLAGHRVVLARKSHAQWAPERALINLIADQNIAKTGSNLKRCTLTWTKYVLPKLFDDGMQHNIFDTMGIENPELEPYEYHRSIKDASRLLRKLDECGGTSLLVYCIKKQRVNSALQNNYQLFHESWWTRNHALLKEFQIVVEGHACVTTLKDKDVAVKYRESKEAVCELIRQYAAVTPVSGGWKQEGIVSAFKRRFGRPNPEDKKLQHKIQKDLEGQCGMKKELASKVAETLVYP